MNGIPDWLVQPCWWKGEQSALCVVAQVLGQPLKDLEFVCHAVERESPHTFMEYQREGYKSFFGGAHLLTVCRFLGCRCFMIRGNFGEPKRRS